MRRKIKECICDSTNKMNIEGGNPIFPICLSHFLTSMADILLVDAEQRLKMDRPDIDIGGEKFKGQAKENPTVLDVLRIWMGADFTRNIEQHTQLHGFLDWLMEQYEPDDEDDDDFIMWYDIKFLTEKWNEYAEAERKRRGSYENPWHF